MSEYHYSANAFVLNGTPLLTCIIEERGDLEFIRALLAAKVNLQATPHETVRLALKFRGKTEKDTFTDLRAMLNEAGHQETKLSVKAVKTSEAGEIHHVELDNNAIREYAGTTALHVAAKVGYLEAIQLLLAKGARSTMPDNERFTPFGCATHSKTNPVIKAVLEAFLGAGHHIDERNGGGQSSGLYLACQNNKPGDVKIFLQLHANPCLTHHMQGIRDGQRIAVTVTPLSIAATRGYTPILMELVKGPLPSREIYRAIQNAHKDLKCREVLRKAYVQALNREGNTACKAGDLVSAELAYSESLQHTNGGEERHSIYYNLGVCLFKAHKLREAHEALDQCLLIRAFLLPKDHPGIQKAEGVQREIGEAMAACVNQP